MTDPTGILERLMAYRMGLSNDEPELMDLLRDLETTILSLEKERDESELAHINLGIEIARELCTLIRSRI
jgi:hypothetical protein